MKFFDQLSRTIEIKNFPPEKIISVVPSQTELLFDLGLKNKVIGITKFCVHPEKWFHSKTRIGGTKKINLEKISDLKPDLIIANKEENSKTQIEELHEKFPVWISDVKNLGNALKMIVSIGEITNRIEKAEDLVNAIISQFDNLKKEINNWKFREKKVIYLIWKNPLIAVGKNTFINDMLQRCGFKNVCLTPDHSPQREGKIRYPEISAEELQKINPEIILLSSEPYPFRKKHIAEFQQICPKAKIILVDGEMFSWYGSRLLKAPKYFLKLLHQIIHHKG